MRIELFFCIVSFLVFANCTPDPIVNTPNAQIEINPADLSYIDSSPQRSGDSADGLEYLLTGDYVSSGIPYDTYIEFFGTIQNDPLEREGLNTGIRHDFNAFIASNGVPIVAPNCLQCHASILEGELVVGLGNIDGDFTTDQSGLYGLLDQLIISSFGANSKEWEAYYPFSIASQTIGSEIKTETVGSNPADKIAALLAAHRDKNSLEWEEEDLLGVPNEVIPTDIPAWWNLKKKNSMFYTAVGRGDFARISMASSLLTIQDTAKAREIDSHFNDVIAFINSIEAPPYKGDINIELALQGEGLFIDNCTICHGTYDANETYPNLLIDLDLIQTDSNLIYANFGFEKFVDWYNDSWFGKEPFAARLKAERGYIAPPLDGVWATAPYLHNGSIPNLKTLLNSSERPSIWKRMNNENIYDHINLGWEYETLTSKTDKWGYDTSLKAYSNEGHLFGDHFTEEERMAVLEYLKTI